MNDRGIPLYPLHLRPIYLEKIWGWRRIEQLGRQLPGGADTPIGESWELADLPGGSNPHRNTSDQRSVITNGPLAGSTLHDLIAEMGPRFMGRLHPTQGGDFPLLVKYLDAREHLSLQVHPTAAYAADHPEASLKSEAWYVVAAEPGSVIYKGLRPDVTPETFHAAAVSGDAGRIEPLMQIIPARIGDCHYLPSGLCHALGAGVMVAEVQTPSDTTFRVYDWGRDRATDLQQAMACMRFGDQCEGESEKRSHIAGMFTTISRLVSCDHFRIEKVRMVESYEHEIPYDQPTVWMVLEGKGIITSGKGIDPVQFTAGQTMLIPAGIEEARVALHADTVWLEVTFPQAWQDLLA